MRKENTGIHHFFFLFPHNVFYHIKYIIQVSSSESYSNCQSHMLSILDKSLFLLYGKEFTHSHTMTPFGVPGKQAYLKHCGKRRNCSLGAISPFPVVFSTRLDNFLPFSSNFELSSANSFSLEESKVCCLVMS